MVRDVSISRMDERKPMQLYYWPTPNGWKVTIFLEETDTPYEVIPVDIGRGDQFDPNFLRIGPNNKMPVIVDPEGPGGEAISVFESGAILIYLAEKTARFLPKDWRARTEVMQWLMFQMGGFGPMLGQLHHFRNYTETRIPYAIDRYYNETRRLYGVLNRRLADRDFVAGDYSIADMALFPWAVAHENQGIALEEFPSVKKWYERIHARDAVQRGLAVMAEDRRPMDDAAKDVLFNKKF
jgi:GSH-dependent disulfide-bond oxidoreductase